MIIYYHSKKGGVTKQRKVQKHHSWTQEPKGSWGYKYTRSSQRCSEQELAELVTLQKLHPG